MKNEIKAIPQYILDKVKVNGYWDDDNESVSSEESWVDVTEFIENEELLIAPLLCNNHHTILDKYPNK